MEGWQPQLFGRRIASTWRQFTLFKRSYSWRSAVIGSTDAALRAGMKQARRATNASTSAVPASVAGSEAVTPYRRLPRILLTAIAPRSPSVRPTATNREALPITMMRMSRDFAPSATRKPIS